MHTQLARFYSLHREGVILLGAVNLCFYIELTRAIGPLWHLSEHMFRVR